MAYPGIFCYNVGIKKGKWGESMKLLEDRIRKDGVVKDGDVLKVDSFLNHQMDVELFAEMGLEWARLFADDHVTKILTIEASGIGIACLAAQQFHVPVVFAKKNQTKNIAGDVYTAKVESFTHGRVYDIIVAKQFLDPGDRVLLIDDFLAKGAGPPGADPAGAGVGGHPGGGRYRRGKGFPDRRRPDPGDGRPGGVPGPDQVHGPGGHRVLLKSRTGKGYTPASAGCNDRRIEWIRFLRRK